MKGLLHKHKKLLLGVAVVSLVVGIGLGALHLSRGDGGEVDSLAGLSESEAAEVTGVVMSAARVTELDEEYFNLEFDLEKRVVRSKTGEAPMAEFLQVSEGEVEKLVADGLLDEFLDYNLLGEVKVNAGVVAVSNPYSTNTLVAKAGDAQVLEKYPEVKSVREIGGYYLVKYDSAVATKAGYEELKRDGAVEGVVTDLEVTVDEMSGVRVRDVGEVAGALGMSGLRGGATSGSGVASLNNNVSAQLVPSEAEAWGVTAMGADHYTAKLILSGNEEEVLVAVLDTGINATHDAFASEETADRLDMTRAYDYINKDNDPVDDQGHGTAVAGAVVEATPDNVKVVPLKVMDDSGHGGLTTIVEAAKDASAYAQVINMSLGMTINDENRAAVAYFDEMLAAVDAIMVAATGNDGTNASDYPACGQYAWGIGAVDSGGAIADFSNYDEYVDFVAPGVAMVLPWYTGDSAYISGDGTSFAAPFAAAAVAMILAEHPDYTKSQVYQALEENAEDLGAAGKDIYYGNGSLNFNSGMFSKPVFALAEVEQIWSAEANAVTVAAVSKAAINELMVTDTDAEPDSWRELGNTYDYAYFNFDLDENGVYYIWLRDVNGAASRAEVTVDHIDSTAPEVVENLSAVTLTHDKVKVKAVLKEEGSGVASIDWTIKAEGAASGTTETETFGNESGGETGAELLKMHTFNGLESEKNYEVSAVVKDLVGNQVAVPAVTLATTAEEAGDGEEDGTLVQAEVSTVMGLVLLNPSDLTAEVEALEMDLTPGGAAVTSGLVARMSGNAALKLTMSMVGSETALVREGGGRIEATATEEEGGAALEGSSWGYQLDGTEFLAVPGVGAAVTVGTMTSTEGTLDTGVTFGARAGADLLAGEYGGVVVLTVAVDG